MLSVWHLNVQVHNRFYEKAKIILIVEDDADIGSFLVATLQQETPFHPILVNDGFAALLMTAGLGMPRHAFEKRKLVGLNKPLELAAFLQLIDELLQHELE